MSTLNYTARYRKNTGTVMSPVELREAYLYGINVHSTDGSELPTVVWEQKIAAAQLSIERFLAIRFVRQLVTERLTYHRDDYLNNLPILTTSYPVYKPVNLLGLLNNIEQIKYPVEWLNSYECSDDMSTRRINLVPSGSSVSAQTNVVLIGIMAQLGIRSLNIVPNYWTAQFLTGWSPATLPMELVDVVGKLAAIQILAILGDLVLPPGLSGSSLSIDGLSQSVNTPISGQNSAFGGRIKQYSQDIKDTLERVKGAYKGINFATL